MTDGLPTGLRREHRTRPGVWALIHVLEGRLLYRVLEPRAEYVLEPGASGVVRPGQTHEVAPLSAERFVVEFLAAVPQACSPHGDAAGAVP